MQALEARLSGSYSIYKQIWALLKKADPFPFSLSHYQSFLGYRSLEAALAAAREQDPKAQHIKELSPPGKEESDWLLGKSLFLSLARKRRNADPWVKDLQLWYKASLIDKKVRAFDDSAEARELTAWDIPEQLAGRFYAYSLDTYHIALDLEMAPATLFNLLNEKGMLSWASFVGHKREAIWLEAEQEYGTRFVPYASFNSLDSDKRDRIFELLEFLWQEAPLSPEQSSLLETLAIGLQETLEKQREIDKARQEAKDAEAREKARLAEVELRELYKVAAKICHPDRHPEPKDKALAETLFQELNQAYQSQDLEGVEKACETIHQQWGQIALSPD